MKSGRIECRSLVDTIDPRLLARCNVPSAGSIERLMTNERPRAEYYIMPSETILREASHITRVHFRSVQDRNFIGDHPNAA